MTGNSNKILLRKFLKGEIDERLFNYVADNANNVLFYSFEQLCDKANVSQEELHAFFQAFGVDSLNVFKEFLRYVIYYEATPLGEVQRPLTSIAEEMIRYEIQNLVKYAAQLDCGMIECLAKDILSASEVIVFGSRVANIYADRLVNLLKRRGVKVRKLDPQEFGAEESDLNALGPSALVIAFGVALYWKRDILYLRQLRDRGIRIVSVTDHDDSPFTFFADYSFVFPVQSIDFMDSLTTGMLFINLLTLCVAMQDMETMITDLNAVFARTEEAGLLY